MIIIGRLFFVLFLCFFFNDPATTEIYTLSLHDALPIWPSRYGSCSRQRRSCWAWPDRKSTRLNSSHVEISYAVFCLKKKKIPLTHFCSSTKTPHAPLTTEESDVD